MSPNPAYRQVTSIALQENSAYSIVHTVSPAAAQYKNIAVDDKLSESTTLSVSVVDKCLSIAAANSLPQYEVPVSPNPACECDHCGHYTEYSGCYNVLLYLQKIHKDQ